jgi:hypothetical protein
MPPHRMISAAQDLSTALARGLQAGSGSTQSDPVAAEMLARGTWSDLALGGSRSRRRNAAAFSVRVPVGARMPGTRPG